MKRNVISVSPFEGMGPRISERFNLREDGMHVLLRLRGLTGVQHRDLLLVTDEGGVLYPSVEYKSTTHDKDGYHIDLRIETERDMFAPGSDKVPVLHETIDKLWEILGIFPKTSGGSNIFELASVQNTIRDITTKAQTVTTGTVGRFPEVIKAGRAIISLCENLEAQVGIKKLERS